LILLIVLVALVLSVLPVQRAVATQRSGLSIVARSAGGFTLALSAPDYTVSEVELATGRFSQVFAEGLEPAGPVGAPALPAVSVRFVVPMGAPVELTLVTTDDREVPLPAPLVPLPRIEASGWTPEQPGAPLEVYEPDPAYYSAPVVYPLDVCRISADDVVREWRLVEVRCQPLRYRPSDRTLLVTQSARLELSFQAGGNAASSIISLSASPAYAALAAAVANPEDLGRYAALGPQSGLRAQALPEPQGRFRLMTSAGSGLYAVTYQELVAAGAPLAGVASASLRLFAPGLQLGTQEEVAIEVEDADGVFGGGDRIVFYAPERQSPYGTTNAFWLDWGGAPGMRVAPRAAGTPDGGQSIYLTATAQMRNYDPRYPDPWRSDWTNLYAYEPSYTSAAEDGHFFAGLIQTLSLQDMPDREWFAVELTGSALGQGTLSLSLRGLDEPQSPVDHLLQAEFATGTEIAGTYIIHLPLVQKAVGGAQTVRLVAAEPTYTPLGSIAWNGIGPYSTEFTVAVGRGLHVLRLLLPGQPNGSGGYIRERSYIAAPRLSYPLGRATQDAALGLGREGANSYALDGFTSMAIRVWDVTLPGAAVALTGLGVSPRGSEWHLAFADTPAGAATYAIASEAGLKRVAAIAAVQPVTLAPGAQYLIVAHPSLLPAAQALAAHRQAKSGLSVRIVSTQEIYDRYSSGLLDAEAIRAFVNDAYASWLNPDSSYQLTYLLLMGDGSYDFKDRLNHGEANYLPPYLVEDLDPNWAAQAGSDHRFANTDRTPASIFVGRIPARDLTTALGVVSKIISYENGDSGSWANRALFSVDDPDRRDYGGGEVTFSFEAVSEAAVEAATSDGRLQPSGVMRVYQAADSPPPPGYYYNDGDLDTEALLARWRLGDLITYYAGHSHYWGWAFPKLFESADIASMGPTPSTVLLSLTCFTGVFYHPTAASLDEALLLAPDRGTVGSFSPLSMGSASGHRMLQGPLLQALMRGSTLGEALLAGQLALDVSYRDLIDTYAVFGDPALRLAGAPTQAQYTVMLPLALRTGG